MTGVGEAAARLAAAADRRRPCPPVRDLLPAGDINAAYAVQTALIGARTSNGATLVGWKIGLTNPKVQAQLGVDQPDFGKLLDDMACLQDTAVDHSRLLQPRIEAEIAFVLTGDLDQPGDISTSAVRAAAGYAVAALEIVDSRIAGWDISIVDTVADNASSGLFVLGATHTPLHRLDPAAVGMSMTRNGEVVSTGSGADCLGDPLTAVAWLATTARDYGQPLRAGDVILSGALGPMVPVAPGDTFQAEFTSLGSVHASFTTHTQEAP
jgi:2-keto-4-pentenoate hydratase